MDKMQRGFTVSELIIAIGMLAMLALMALAVYVAVHFVAK